MIEQLTVRKLRGRRGERFVLVLQSHLLEGLDTVIVAPLLTAPRPRDEGIAVTLQIDGEEYQAALNQLAPVLHRAIGPQVISAKEREDEIRRGLDRLFTGF